MKSSALNRFYVNPKLNNYGTAFEISPTEKTTLSHYFCKKMNSMKRILFLVLSFFAIQAFAYSKYDITIKVKGLEPGQNAYLGYYFADKQYLMDTVKVQPGGVCHFKNTRELPGGLFLFVTQDIQYFEFIFNQSTPFELVTDTADRMIKNMKTVGSPENQHFFDYIHFLDAKRKVVDPLNVKAAVATGDEKTKLDNEIKAINKEVEDYRKNYISKYFSTEFFAKMLKGQEDVDMSKFPKKADGSYDTLYQLYYYRAHFWDNFDYTDERFLYSPLYVKKFNQWFDDLTVTHPDSIIDAIRNYVTPLEPKKELFKYVVHTLTSKYENSKIMGMEKVLIYMGETYYLSGKAFWADEVAVEKFRQRIKTLKYNQLGVKAVNLILPDSTGKNISLYSLKAPITMVVFWNPDCGHCQKEVPELLKVYKRLQPLGMKAYTVDTEFDPVKWKKFIKDEKLDWVNVNDYQRTTDFRTYYDVYSTPVVYLLDENKTIIAKRLTPEQIEDFLRNWYKEQGKTFPTLPPIEKSEKKEVPVEDRPGPPSVTH